MTALDPHQRATHARTLQALFGAVETVEEVPAGHAFSLVATAPITARVGEFLALERLCCPFFDFAIELPAGARLLRLLITGPEGVKPFIEAEFGLVLPPGVSFGGRANSALSG
jgi:hypothetical protein